MTSWPKDNQTARNASYGDPGKGQIAAQMVPVVPPFAMYYEGKRVKAIQFHRKAAPALLAALQEIWDYCQHEQARVDAAGVSKYAGAYNPRKVRGSATKWSNHAYAAAIDLNAGENALGVAKGTMPQFVVDAFCRQGAMWGGWYKSRPDWMHFEFVDNGGRQPKSPRPVFGKVARLLDEPGAPPDDIEDMPSAPVADDDDVDPELLAVQQRLKGRHYSPGRFDGKWGGGISGALCGFANDRHLAIGQPDSVEAFHAIMEPVKADLAWCEANNWYRPVFDERKAADPAVVAEIAPEVVPVKRNFLAAAWAFVVSIVTAIVNWFSNAIASAWDFFTDHKDDLPTDPGLLQTAWGWITGLPPIVWILLVGGLFGFIALNARTSAKTITTSVATGARQ